MTKGNREPCAFCPATADITGEHLWDAWAGRMFDVHDYQITRKDHRNRTVRTWPSKHLNSKTNVVCGRCNNGWMSDLVDRTKPIIADMVMKCAPTTLQAKDIATIAAWAYTKAIVADHSHHNTEPFWTFAERQSFRRTLSIPNGVQMWLASLRIPKGLYKSYLVQTPLNTPQRFELNVFTFGLGFFAIQVLTARWMKKAFRRHADPPRVTQNKVWDEASIPVWPSDGNPISWPPGAHLAHQAVDEFDQRWTRLERRW